MSRFAWEPPTTLDLGDDRSRPRTASDLLRDLGVETDPVWVQREAVYGWLSDWNNTVDDLLSLSLRRRGLPAGALDVPRESEQHVHVMSGTATMIAEDPWETVVFAFPRRLQVTYTFQPTGGIHHVVSTIGDPAADSMQPVRRRDGTQVS